MHSYISYMYIYRIVSGVWTGVSRPFAWPFPLVKTLWKLKTRKKHFRLTHTHWDTHRHWQNRDCRLPLDIFRQRSRHPLLHCCSTCLAIDSHSSCVCVSLCVWVGGNLCKWREWDLPGTDSPVCLETERDFVADEDLSELRKRNPSSITVRTSVPS